ncbi:unnamed protein product [Mytilus coruscus]|uniref:Uncharacterized protein n=1 Tax=Mytilus coruscus TaxID=42192 RepID=A0A6J8AXT8_MYTCO|nr:unnamed protein product [Mytilus coruscus]
MLFNFSESGLSIIEGLDEDGIVDENVGAEFADEVGTEINVYVADTEINSSGTQIHPNSKDSAMQTPPPVERYKQSTLDVKTSLNPTLRKKGKSRGNGSQHQKCNRNYNNNNILVIESSLLKSINAKDLINTSVSTTRGARIVDIINIVNDKNIRQYKSIIVHIGANDISNGVTLNLINHEKL